MLTLHIFIPNEPAVGDVQLSLDSKAAPLSNLSFVNPVIPKAPQTIDAPALITSVQSLPVTKLNWILQGIYFEKNSNQSMAIVKTNQKVYSVFKGDSIENGVTLEAIGATYIVLNNKQNLERLTLNQKELKALSQNIQITNKPKKPNYQNILNAVSIKPIQQKDKVGMALFNQNNQHFLEQYGLQNGDILLEINNQPATIKTLQQTLTYLDKNEKISAKIERQGTIQNITINLK